MAELGFPCPSTDEPGRPTCELQPSASPAKQHRIDTDLYTLDPPFWLGEEVVLHSSNTSPAEPSPAWPSLDDPARAWPSLDDPVRA